MANKFDDLLEHFGSNSETLNKTVLVDKRYLEEQKRKAKAFDEILKLEKETSLYSIKGKEDLELGIEIRKIINEYMEDK